MAATITKRIQKRFIYVFLWYKWNKLSNKHKENYSLIQAIPIVSAKRCEVLHGDESESSHWIRFVDDLLYPFSLAKSNPWAIAWSSTFNISSVTTTAWKAMKPVTKMVLKNVSKSWPARIPKRTAIH